MSRFSKFNLLFILKKFSGVNSIHKCQFLSQNKNAVAEEIDCGNAKVLSKIGQGNESRHEKVLKKVV